MVGTRGLPATWGGVERHVEELGARLAAHGHDVTVYCRSGYGQGERGAHRGMRLTYVPTVDTRAVEALVHSVRSAVHARRAGYDVVHFHAVGPGLAAPISRWRTSAAVVQTVHGLDAQRQKWGRAASTLLRAGTWCSAHVPHATITVSKALKEHYAAAYGREVSYIQNGVTPGPRPSSEHLLERFGLQPGSYLLYVGRLVPEKAPDVLVKAFAGVREPGLRLVLAGGSSHTDGYQETVQGLAAQDDRVLMPGYVFGDDLAALYTHARGFVLPSHLEGLPLTLLEAASYGLPLVLSDIPPHREVIGAEHSGARLTAPGSVDGLRFALERSLADPVTESLGAADVSQAVLSHYNWDLTALLTEKLYAEAMVKAGRPLVQVAPRVRGVHVGGQAPALQQGRREIILPDTEPPTARDVDGDVLDQAKLKRGDAAAVPIRR